MTPAMPLLPSDRGLRADAAVHALGLALGLAGAIVLVAMVVRSPSPGQLAPILVYIMGLLSMLGCSAAYNLRLASPHRSWLRRLDHAAIFVMIAGTYTPLVVLRLPEPWSTGLLTAIWMAAAAGIAAKLFLPHRIEALSVALYLIMGWIGLVALDVFVTSVERDVLVLVLLGGLVYSGGVVFHLSSRPRYRQALWHASVLVAAAIHYFAIVALVQR